MLNRLGAFCGLLGVAGNIAGVVLLGDIPSAYRPEAVGAWFQQVVAAPVAASWSATAFTIGLVALVGWALALGRELGSPSALLASTAIATGALLNAAGTPAPLVVALHVGPVCGSMVDCLPLGAALLATSLALDALFNLLLGIGLVLLAGSLWRAQISWRWLAPLAAIAGLMTVPVSLQVVSPRAADWLVVAGPLWLCAVIAISAWLWKRSS